MDDANDCVLNESGLRIIEKEEITTISINTTVEYSEPDNENGVDPVTVTMNDDDDSTISSNVSKTSVINKNATCDDSDEPMQPTDQTEESNDDKLLLRLTFKNSETFNELHNVISTAIRDALFKLKKSAVVSVDKDMQTVNFMTVDGIDEDIFMIDTLPTEATNNIEIPDYKSGFEKVLNDECVKEEEKTDDDKPTGNCWNCSGNHNLRDCKQPRDTNQINKSKQAFMRTKDKAERYHLDVDQRFGHFLPGQISDELKQALGLKKRELPMYIYKMRVYGYPPGWLEDAKVSHSGLSLFNSEVSCYIPFLCFSVF